MHKSIGYTKEEKFFAVNGIPCQKKIPHIFAGNGGGGEGGRVVNKLIRCTNKETFLQ